MGYCRLSDHIRHRFFVGYKLFMAGYDLPGSCVIGMALCSHTPELIIKLLPKMPFGPKKDKENE